MGIHLTRMQCQRTDQVNACGDQSSSEQTETQVKVDAGREQTSTQSKDVRPVTDPEGNLRPERPLNLTTSFEIRL